nr:uncharacterized protein LOC128700101 isoform X3 [Cherax quadricarinatus]
MQESSQTSTARNDFIAMDELSSYSEGDILPDKSGEEREDEGGQQMPMMVRGDNQQLWPGGNLVYKLDYDVEDNVYGE